MGRVMLKDIDTRAPQRTSTKKKSKRRLGKKYWRNSTTCKIFYMQNPKHALLVSGAGNGCQRKRWSNKECFWKTEPAGCYRKIV